jgi:hypothetical protein
MTAKPIDTGFFEPPSVGMPNPYSGGGGGSPFSGIEGLLMEYAMEDAMGSAQQNAQQKVGGVMSGIQSLVSEAFPNFSGGMGSGTVGGGSNSITQPTSPAPFTTTIPPSDMGFPKIDMMGGDLSHIITNKGSGLDIDMGHPFMGDLSQISTPASLLGDPTAPLLGGGGGPPMVGGSGMGNPMAMMDGPMIGGIPPMGPTAPMGPPPMGPMGGPPPMGPPPMSEPAGPPPGVPPVDPSSVGLGGNPMIFQPPMTDPTTINPALTDPPMLPKMADFGPVSATIDPTVDMMEYNPAINYNVYKPAMDESGGAIDFSIVDNPAMEYNPVFPMPQLPQQDPLINLAYNYNMENSPF